MDDWDVDNTLTSSSTQVRDEIFKVSNDPASDPWGIGASASDGWDGGGKSNNNDVWNSGNTRGFGNGGRGGRGGGKCYNCNGEGHLSRDCTEPRLQRGRGGGGSRACFNCQMEGHNSRDCPEPRTERGRGRGGGRGGRRSDFSSGGGWESYGDGNGSGDAWGSGNIYSTSNEWESGNAGGLGDGWGYETGGASSGRSNRNFGQQDQNFTEPRAKPGQRWGGRDRGRGHGGHGGGFGDSHLTGGSWGATESLGGGDDGWGSFGTPSFGGRGIPKGCFNCGQQGHNLRDCTEPKKQTCRRCGEEGHIVQDCSKAGEAGRVPVTYVPEEEEETEESIFHRGTEAGINFSRYENVPVLVTGQNAPSAIKSFDNVGLHNILISNIKKAGYTVPTPVQKHAIPIVMGKRDLISCAQTGSGKTAAYLIPIINHLLENGCGPSSFGEKQSPEAVVMCPTRELAQQIEKEAHKFAYGSGVKTVVIHGGVQPRYHAERVRRGCNILVATPGRLLDFMEKGILDFAKCKFLVLDEADRMLDMGFQGEVKKVVFSPTMPNKEERNTLMFSATFQKEVQQLAYEFLHNYLFLTVGVVGGACSDVRQEIYLVDFSERVERLKQLLLENQGVKTLIFTSSKKSADFLAAMLSSDNFSATSIHGDRLQSQREEAVRDFTSGRRNILVATAVAARGLDIKGVALVINYELPNDIDEYVHRIGRTGRVGNTGRAISFYNEAKDSELAGKLVTILSNAQQEVPEFLRSAASGMSISGSVGNSKFGGSDIRNFGYDGQCQMEVE